MGFWEEWGPTTLIVGGATLLIGTCAYAASQVEDDDAPAAAPAQRTSLPASDNSSWLIPYMLMRGGDTRDVHHYHPAPSTPSHAPGFVSHRPSAPSHPPAPKPAPAPAPKPAPTFKPVQSYKPMSTPSYRPSSAGGYRSSFSSSGRR